MASGERSCLHCGWRNDINARMCGGCGTPLQYLVPETVAGDATVGSGWPAHTSGTPSGYSPNAPTVYLPNSAPGYSGAPVTPATPATAWPGSAGPYASAPFAVTPKRRSWWKRALVALLVLAAVLVCGLLGLWSAILRPALHNSVDTQLRAALSADMRQVPAIPPGIPQVKYPLPATSVNTALAQDLPDSSGLSQLTVHFIDGNVVFTYDTKGNKGTVTTRLTAQNGHLVAQDTVVTGVLSLVENNREMQNAIDDSLSQLPQQDKFTKVDTAFDTLFVTVGGQ